MYNRNNSRYLVIEMSSANQDPICHTRLRTMDAAYNYLTQRKANALFEIGKAEGWAKQDRPTAHNCPVCGGTLSYSNSEVRGFGEIHRFWTCPHCASTGKALFVDSPKDNNPFVGHRSVEHFAAAKNADTDRYLDMNRFESFTYGDARSRYFSAFVAPEPKSIKAQLDLEVRILQEAMQYDTFVPDSHLAERALIDLIRTIRRLPDDI